MSAMDVENLSRQLLMKARHTAIFVCALMALPSLGLAQGITQHQADEILKELKGIRQAIEALQKSNPPSPSMPARPVDDRVRLGNLSSEHMLGRSDAPLTIVEFTDLQCPFCSRFATTTFDEIKKEYIDTGKVRFISRDLPLTNLHPHAQRAAIAARCAGEQNNFWQLRTLLVRNASLLTPPFIDEAARQLNLNVPAFSACMTSGRFDAAVQKDAADAASVGITGTPTFVIGRSAGTSIDGVKLIGAQPFAVFDARLRQVLSETK
jgi:protein-disulfide isomerase